jgi:S-adenosylmethionine synthetase
MNIEILPACIPVMNDASCEVVERKGLGHPDTVCDLIAERVSYDLGRYYLKACGRILHYNVDKSLLVGGMSEPRFGGGTIIEPAKLYMGDRAVGWMNGQPLRLDATIESSIARWLTENLRFLRFRKGLIWQNEIRAGSATLNSVEERDVCNDTSVGVGYWPLSDLESMTLAVEEEMNSSRFKENHPETGEDIKVMSVRRGMTVDMTIACAFVDAFVTDVADYIEKKEAVLAHVSGLLAERYSGKYRFSVALNALDDPREGAAGLYLTVSGLSCEGGDSGQVGRGNRVNGLISFMRPQTMEAWAGKNFKTHVGKIYSFAATNLARLVVTHVPEIREATIFLVSRIGSPVAKPAQVFADFKVAHGRSDAIKSRASDVLRTAIEEGEIFRPEALFAQAPGEPLIAGKEHAA